VLRLLVFYPPLSASVDTRIYLIEDIPRLLLRKPEISRLIGLGAETDVLVMTANEFVTEGLET
jgi:hypothetical protein